MIKEKEELATTTSLSTDAMSALILRGDLSKFSDQDKLTYYKTICDRTGLDWSTKPFDYLTMQGKQTLYLNKSGAEQLNKLHNVSVSVTNTERIDEIYIVTARAALLDRFNESTGAVAVKGLGGDALANAYMRAETKAKRRATLGLLGLAMLDESEVQTIPGAHMEPASIAIAPTEDIATESQLKELGKLAKEADWSQDKLKEHIFLTYAKNGVNKENFFETFTVQMYQEVKAELLEAAVPF